MCSVRPCERSLVGCVRRTLPIGYSGSHRLQTKSNCNDEINKKFTESETSNVFLTTNSTWLMKTQTRNGFLRSCSLSFHSMFNHKILDGEQKWSSSHLAQILLPYVKSRNSAIHPSYHSATRMKKTTNVARTSIPSLDQFRTLAGRV